MKNDNQETNNINQIEQSIASHNNALQKSEDITKITRRTHVSQNNTIEINPFLLVGIIFAIILVWLTVASLKHIFRSNPYGNEIKIDNFTSFFPDTSEDTRNNIYSSLYIAVDYNVESLDSIPKKGAIIREGSVKSDYHSGDSPYYSNIFLVDIPEIQQSYKIVASWPADSKTKNDSNVYLVSTYCPIKSDMIYESFDCHDPDSNQGVTNNPIMAHIPIKVDYFTDDYRDYISYTITAQISDDNQKLVVYITSYSGNAEENYKAALDKLRELNINPENYNIEYIDDSSMYDTPAKS